VVAAIIALYSVDLRRVRVQVQWVQVQWVQVQGGAGQRVQCKCGGGRMTRPAGWEQGLAVRRSASASACRPVRPGAVVAAAHARSQRHAISAAQRSASPAQAQAQARRGAPGLPGQRLHDLLLDGEQVPLELARQPGLALHKALDELGEVKGREAQAVQHGGELRGRRRRRW
jgi:hypothetical protein